MGQSLFSLILPSCMVAPNREIVNKYPFIFSSAMSNQVEIKKYLQGYQYRQTERQFQYPEQSYIKSNVDILYNLFAALCQQNGGTE